MIPLEQFKNERGELEVSVGDDVEVALDSVEDGIGRNPSVARESQARPHLDASRTGFREAGNRQGHHQRPRQGRLHGRDRFRPRVPARFAGRRAPGARSVVSRRQGARVQGHQARPEAQQRRRIASRSGRAGKQRRARRNCSRSCRKARSSRASSRTSPITVRSSTSAASMACCTSPTWRGSASSIRRKSSTSVTRSTCAS